MNGETRAGGDEKLDRVIGELIALRWSDDLLQLEVFGNRISSDQYRIVYTTALKHLAPGSNVLDWGCGNGHFSYFLLKMGFRVTGYSFLDSPRLMEPFGSRFTFVRGTEADPRKIPFASGEFDAVLSMGVLEHVRETGGDEPSSLGEIGRVLKPGGVFLCAHLPNRRSWIEFLTRHFTRSKFHHRYRFTKDDIETLWNGARLERRVILRYGWLPRNLWSGMMRPPLPVPAFDLLERCAKFVLYPFHQNYLIVAFKRDGTSAPGAREPEDARVA